MPECLYNYFSVEKPAGTCFDKGDLTNSETNEQRLEKARDQCEPGLELAVNGLR